MKSEEAGMFGDYKTMDKGERGPATEPQKEQEGWKGDPYDSDVNRIGDLDLTPWLIENSSDSEEDDFYLSRAEGMQSIHITYTHDSTCIASEVVLAIRLDRLWPTQMSA
jgi:hypothetical protein